MFKHQETELSLDQLAHVSGGKAPPSGGGQVIKAIAPPPRPKATCRPFGKDYELCIIDGYEKDERIR